MPRWRKIHDTFTIPDQTEPYYCPWNCTIGVSMQVHRILFVSLVHIVCWVKVSAQHIDLSSNFFSRKHGFLWKIKKKKSIFCLLQFCFWLWLKNGTDTRVLQKVLSLGSGYFSATFYHTYFYYKPSKYSPFTETHFCNLSQKADK